MSTILAILVLIALLLAIILPATVVGLRRKAAVWALPFYLLLLGAVTLYYGGLSFGDRPAAAQPQSAPSASLCEEAVTQSERGGLVLDRSNPNRVTVRGQIWSQLPERARQALTHCLQTVRPGAGAQTPIEIIEAPAR